ncbi:sulfatase-like hydrolase/transferase [Gimibacter soli]|uniref:Sulfatase-like hydrolase/transferase n=1 Tax=Gimibacter soli TaxID=3024400 RepID=A0AAF0BK40_9PROT|nr:sulfatase-like hydrolase/transferase [Gimibacter soli]WCL53849.1 sulfatase-like hydrolase/transferase [Gimibacter soli]
MIRTRTAWLAGAALVVAAGLGALYQYRIYIPGIIDRISDPIAKNQPVVWEKGPTPTGEKGPPNIIVVLVDDLGINDISTFGGGVADGAVQTPSIDAIAAEGATFTSGYAGNATCAPSRAAIMTGRFATRFGFEFTPAPVPFHRLLGSFDYGPQQAVYHADREADTIPLDDQGLPSEEITVAELLQQRGYRTLFLGKWHLGGAEKFRPHNQGFDEWLGFMPGAAMFLPKDHPDVVNSVHDFDPIDRFLWANLTYAVSHNGGQRFHPDRYMTDYLADQAVSAIEANAGRPFFMYLALNAPHTPLQALKSDYDALSGIADHRLRVYGAMIRAVDRAVGKVEAALDKAGIADNTMVIFTSDNGGASYIGFPDINKPYRGWKASFFEGGIRVPMLVSWPDRIPAGVVIDEPAAHVDIFATAAAAAGAPLPTDRQIDGQDMLARIANPDAPPADRALFWRSDHYRVLLHKGWKLQVSELPKKTWLFNLNEDPTEQVNLAEREPARLAAMRAALDALNAEQATPIWPSLVAPPVYIDKNILEEKTPEDEYVNWAN